LSPKTAAFGIAFDQSLGETCFSIKNAPTWRARASSKLQVK
jgi:hypothetical protein